MLMLEKQSMRDEYVGKESGETNSDRAYSQKWLSYLSWARSFFHTYTSSIPLTYGSGYHKTDRTGFGVD